MIPSHCYLVVMGTDRQAPATNRLSAFKGRVDVTAGMVTIKLIHGANTVHETFGSACLNAFVLCIQAMTVAGASEYQLPAVVWWA